MTNSVDANAETSDGALTIDLLRHGETTAGKCFLGSTDAPLSDTGWQQVQAAELLPQYDRVISSPYLRCLAFAQHVAEQLNIPLQVETDLREIHFGDWEGQTSQQLWQADPESLGAYWRDPLAFTPPGAESLQAFQQRVLSRFVALSENLSSQNVLLVSHAGVIKQLLCHVLGMDVRNLHRVSIDHAGLSRLKIWPGSMQLLFVNR